MIYRNFLNQYDELKIKDNELSNSISSIELKIENLKKEKMRINNELGDGVSIGSTFKDYSSKINNITEQLRAIAQVANERKDNLEREDFKNVEQIDNISKKQRINMGQGERFRYIWSYRSLYFNS